MDNSASGLDCQGQFHIGQGITLAVEGRNIRVLCGQTRQSVLATAESVANCLADRYFPTNRLIA
jgi:hypothetical protein